MPNTAREKGLHVNAFYDERDDFDKATRAACYLLGEYYLSIQKRFNISSWVLTVAAYNVGIGNLNKLIEKQGNNYFSMNLNSETASYVYKIIAVKELFEYPEFYMKDFGYNIFNAPDQSSSQAIDPATNTAVFDTLKIDLNTNKPATKLAIAPEAYTFVGATIKGRYKNFSDRDLVTIELQEDLEYKGSFRSKGSVLKGTGWIIDTKIFIDLGYPKHDIVVYGKHAPAGKAGSQGLEFTSLKNNEPVLLKVKKYL